MHLLGALALLLILGSARAGTVTLSGTCPGNTMEGNAFFTLVNSGNDTPYGLTITLHVLGAGLANATYHLKSLPSSTAAEVNVTLPNLTVVGTYPGYFDVTYLQGSDHFTAVFPCEFGFVNATISSLYLTPSVTDNGGGNFTINVSVANGGASKVDAELFMILPPTFSGGSRASKSLTLAPLAQENMSFSVAAPAGSAASYSAAVAAVYVEGGKGYASMSKFVIAPKASQPVNFGTLAFIAAIVVVVALLALMVYVAVIKRGKKGGRPSPRTRRASLRCSSISCRRWCSSRSPRSPSRARSFCTCSPAWRRWCCGTAGRRTSTPRP